MRISKYDKFINENVVYAKSILNRNKITADSPEYQDYLKIREICGNDNGYVGILTKLRFIDGVTDMEEIESIFHVLKNSKFDFAKLNRLTYNEILDLFYNELSGSDKDKKDLELIFKDDQYSYYRVYTYEGILKIGSPSWCLKTKSNWDRYQEKYPEQWVAIDNRYIKNIITPENNYLSEYKPSMGYHRYGISISKNTGKFVAFSDSNHDMLLTPTSWTFYGVMNTIFNLMRGIKKSYYEYMEGMTKCTERLHKINDIKNLNDVLHIPKEDKTNIGDKDEVYVKFSKSYSFPPILFILNEFYPRMLVLTKSDKIELEPAEFKIDSEVGGIISDYASRSDDLLYGGIKLKLGEIAIQDIENHKSFIKLIGKWAVFKRNENYHIVINTDISNYQLATFGLDKASKKVEDPFYFYIDIENKSAYAIDNKELTQPIIREFFSNKKKDTKIKKDNTVENKDRLKRFKDFLGL